jgi:acyl-CoA thioesterase-1
MNRSCQLMLWTVVAACFCVCLLGCKPKAQRDEHNTTADASRDLAQEGLIVAMGDSLTAGLGVPESQAYPAQLERKLRADGYAFKVVNAGVSGETSSGALTRTEWMLTLKPDIVILETGANDGLRGVDPSVVRSNIDAIVKALQAQGVVVVLAGMQMVRNLGANYTAAFAQVYPQIAQQYDLILMPFFLKDVGGKPRLNQRDSIHPTAAGYERIVNNLYPHVTAAIEKLRGQR